MRAQLKGIHSSDVLDLASYAPEDPEDVGVFVEMMVGTADDAGEDLFGITVCTAKWLRNHHASDDLVVLRHHVLIREFDYQKLCEGLRTIIERCTGDSWIEIANQIARIAYWEFEDYVPHKSSPDDS